MCVREFSRVRIFTTPQTVALQSPLSMGFPKQEYWSGLPFPPPGDLPHQGTEPASPVQQPQDSATSTRSEAQEFPSKLLRGR